MKLKSRSAAGKKFLQRIPRYQQETWLIHNRNWLRSRKSKIFVHNLGNVSIIIHDGESLTINLVIYVSTIKARLPIYLQM